MRRNSSLSAVMASNLEALLWGLRRWTIGPLIVVFHRSVQRSVIRADLLRWRELRYPDLPETPMNTDEDMLRYYFLVLQEFRNLFYYRLEQGTIGGILAAKLARRVWRPVDTFDLSCPDIGPGLVVRHGYSTVLTAERIGANCFVHHEVTLGWDDEGDRAPRIGDNVYVGTGAKVLGAITVGNNVRVGANAVVLEDVPDGCTVAGVPARIVKRPERAPLATGPDGGERPTQ
jgi:serine O-acetyltransferase